ncbi:discoidin domain-containing protein [Paenibacillus daejeonensis]|uniref:discoidin domain-containing protein n=1 Tax=Paenibacillus daejeonensis TaxID=135193 RepID=UPI000379CFDD|nr:discoidin domain-containing protein [Paenibacillus daejeonensis]
MKHSSDVDQGSKRLHSTAVRRASRKRVWIATLLALLLMLPVIHAAPPTVSGEESDWPYSLFSHDFENEAVGGLPHVGGAGWTKAVHSAESTLQVVADGSNQVLEFERVPTAAGFGGPRVEKHLSEVTGNLRLDFRVKTFGHRFELFLRHPVQSAPAETRLLRLNGAGLVSGAPAGSAFSGSQFADVSAEINLAALTYSVSIDGLAIFTDEPLHSDFDREGTIELRLSGILEPGQQLQLDNVRIRTDHQFVPWPYSLFSYNFEEDQPGEIPAVGPAGWTNVVRSTTSTVTVVPDGDGQALAFARDAAATGNGGPRVEKHLGNVTGNLRLDFKVQTFGRPFDLELRHPVAAAPATTSLLQLRNLGLVTSPPPGSAFNGNNYVDVAAELNFSSMTYSVWINDIAIKTNAAINPALDKNKLLEIRYSTVLAPGQTVRLDDVSIRTDVDPDADLPWNPDENSVIANLLDEHPRLMATDDDFDAMRLRVQNDPQSQQWYTSMVTSANRMLTLPVSQYGFPDGRTLLQISRQVLDRAYMLSLVYQMSGDDRYAERLWDELEAAAAFPDWNPVSFLSTAEMTHAFAIGYDWLYHYWSEEQRDVLSDAIVNLGLRPGLYGYNQGEWWVTTTNNWNIVTHGGLGMGALAVGDLMPGLADNLITRGLTHLPAAIAEFAPDGGYPEGVGYWAYAIRYLVPYMAALNTATGSDYGLSELPGLAETPLFPLYMGGPSNQAFHFSDVGSGVQQNPDLFWMAAQYDLPEAGWWALQSNSASPRHLLWYDPDHIENPRDTQLPLDAKFRGPEAVSMRSAWDDANASFVGFKGGTNGANHGDLDLGTFVFDALGQRWAEELGTESYSAPGIFSDGPTGQRWTYYRKRAEGQNTLVVNPGLGPDQNATAAGEVVSFESGEREAFAIADLDEAFADRGVSSWQRGVRLFDHRRQLLIQDELTTIDPADVWWFMHTRANIEVAPDGKSAILTLNDEQVLARIASPGPAEFVAMEAEPLWSSPVTSWNSSNVGMRKLSVFLEGAVDPQLAIVLTPIRSGAAIPALPALTPLSGWTLNETPVAQLGGVQLDGVALDDFDPNVYTYDVRGYDVADPVPLVTALTTEPGVTAVVDQASALPGVAVVTVTGPGNAVASYEIYFRTGSQTPSVVTASIEGTFPPSHTIDNDLGTFFSADGIGQWVQYDLGETRSVDGVSLAWYLGNTRAFSFEVQGSQDGDVWTSLTTGTSSGTTVELEDYTFTETDARYIRIVGQGNTTNNWMSITEARIIVDGEAWPEFADTEPQLTQLTAPETLAVNVGNSAPIALAGVRSDGSAADLDDLTIRYIVADSSVVQIDAAGVATGLTAGETNVGIYTVTAERKLIFTSLQIIVTEP